MKRILFFLLLISGFAHGQNAFTGGNTFADTVSYTGNFGSKYSTRSLVDKNYADSNATAKARAAVSVTNTGTSGAATYTSATGVFNIPVYAKPTLTRNLNLESPTAAENKGIFYTPVAITITQVRAVSVGTTPSVTYNIAFGSDRTSGTNVFTAGQTTTSTTTGDVASGVNDNTIPAGSYIWLTTAAAATPPTEILFTITYTED